MRVQWFDNVYKVNFDKNPRFFYQRQVARFIEEITCYTEGLQTGFTNLPAIHSDAHGFYVNSDPWQDATYPTYGKRKSSETNQSSKNGAPKNRQVQKFSQFTWGAPFFLALQNDVMLTHPSFNRWFTCNVWALDDMTAARERCPSKLLLKITVSTIHINHIKHYLSLAQSKWSTLCPISTSGKNVPYPLGRYPAKKNLRISSQHISNNPKRVRFTETLYSLNWIIPFFFHEIPPLTFLIFTC